METVQRTALSPACKRRAARFRTFLRTPIRTRNTPSTARNTRTRQRNLRSVQLDRLDSLRRNKSVAAAMVSGVRGPRQLSGLLQRLRERRVPPAVQHQPAALFQRYEVVGQAVNNDGLLTTTASSRQHRVTMRQPVWARRRRSAIIMGVPNNCATARTAIACGQSDRTPTSPAQQRPWGPRAIAVQKNRRGAVAGF